MSRTRDGMQPVSNEPNLTVAALIPLYGGRGVGS